MLRSTSLSLALLAGLVAGASAQTPSSAGTSATPAMSANAGTSAPGRSSRAARGDSRFVRDAAAGGQAEVTLGEMASQKGASAQVKQYGERMVADHGKANQELMQIASSKGIAATAEPTSQQRRDAEMLRRMSGEAFDRAYARQMVADHRTTVALFEREAKSGRDADLKAFAERTLPSLREHLEMARALGTESASGRATQSSMPMAK